MANTVNLHYTEQGQGSTPLVLLHGYPLSSVIWQEQANSLSNEYRVITPDLRGHGQSPTPEGIYDMELMARDVFALLDTLGIQKAAIMGHSMGGYITLAAYHIAPERFLALGLIDSQAGADSEEARQGRYNTAEKVFMDGSSVVANAMLPKLFVPGFATDESVYEQVKAIILNTKAAGIIGTLKGMAARSDSGPLLPNVDIPVLLITGDKDQIIPPSRAEAMASAIAGATLATIENAGHMPMMEQPQATAMAIRNFLSTINE
jgi:3-oxoadipate enol-lactonase